MYGRMSYNPINSNESELATLKFTHSRMIKKCYDKRSLLYPKYGAIGIKVCDEWLDPEVGFVNFYDWAINNGYNKNLSLDLKDLDGNFCPENCIWIEPSEKMKRRMTRCDSK